MNISQFKEGLSRMRLRASYGIEYLDKELRGIFSGELVLIGAKTGAGKSTIASNMSKYNANAGRKIALFSLENDEGSTFQEEVYKQYMVIEKTYFEKRDFFNNYEILSEESLKKAIDIAKEVFKNIRIIERKPDGFNIADMTEHMVNLARDFEPDLFVIDHVDYFDYHNHKVNENQNISEIMKQIRSIQNVYNIPVVLISHLKKGEKDNIVPALEDFIGTSNKVKEATTVILFAPNDKENTEQNSKIKKTWICIRKDRFGGYNNEACNIGFDKRAITYQKHYELYSVNYWGTKVEPIENKENLLYGGSYD